MNSGKAIIEVINGPVVKANNMSKFKMREMVTVGKNKLIGEVISIDQDIGTIQVYEETEGLSIGELVYPSGAPLSIKLGPGMIGNIFDGIQRPLEEINEMSEYFIPVGIGLLSINDKKKWEVKIDVNVGDDITEGMKFGEVQETSLIVHKLIIPQGVFGIVKSRVADGEYNIEESLLEVAGEKSHNVKMYHDWPVRKPRPTKERMRISQLLVTGQRIFDIFFPIAKGGTAAIPGGFGTGKTMTQHQLVKWSDADIIIYIGCGERGNEMTEVLEDFPKLIDERTGKSIMERTILIANTSNMPVAAREASIYTGITIAEYFRDMGYHVALLADSTSRWAEALREISGRLEEMPAEEGFPAYLPLRLAEFYERAGYVKSLGGYDGSVTIVGSVSPAGGDFSEPVTENSKRFVNAFMALDKKLAYARHFPAINWLESYSGYIKLLDDWYKNNVSDDVMVLRKKILNILNEESSLTEIVQLVGEDVLPDNQRLILEISKIIKIGFLQQNAFHDQDAFVPLDKQLKMLKTIELLYDKSLHAVDSGIPILQVKDPKIFDEVIKMKYNISNNEIEKFDELEEKINEYFVKLETKYNRL